MPIWTRSAKGTSRRGFRYSPAAAGVFSNPAYANSSSSAAPPSPPSLVGRWLAASDHDAAKQPRATNTPRGSSLPMTRITAAVTPERTPTMLMAVNASTGTAMASERTKPSAVAGATKLRACAKPTDSEATDATLASQAIHPTSNPAREPNA